MPHLRWNHHDSLPKRALRERERNKARLKEGKVDRDKVIEMRKKRKGKRKIWTEEGGGKKTVTDKMLQVILSSRGEFKYKTHPSRSQTGISWWH